jgi:putative ABC transport system permease protein
MAVDKMPLLPWPYLLGGALLLLALGQLAVLAPARRAATLAPASVMRS